MSKADEILALVAQNYATCKRFRCHAELNRQIVTDCAIKSCFKMRLDFVRPQQFFLHWWQESKHDFKQHTLIAKDDIVLRHAWEDSIWSREEKLEDAIASHTGISSGLVTHVPCLLLQLLDYSLLDRVGEMEELSIGQESAYLISGISHAGFKTKLKIRADGMITEMHESFGSPGSHCDMMTKYEDIEVVF